MGGYEPLRLTGVSNCCGVAGGSVEEGEAEYLDMILVRAWLRIFHGKTFTSFSMLRGFGFPNAMINLKKSSLSAFALLTVSG